MSKRAQAHRLILASGSPRRKELLKAAGFSFQILIPDIDETERSGESPQKMVLRLSREKAEAVISRLKSSVRSPVLAADTCVVAPNGKVLGKPKSHPEATRMLRSLQGKTHTVLTGYTLAWFQGEKRVHFSRVVKTRVRMRELGGQEIESYLSRGESWDKAGAYAAQGFGMSLIEKISGSYTNVVGLPLAQVIEDYARITR